jgi:hypothetical protein
VQGWVGAGALIEFFIAAPDPTGFGEGQTYLFAATEGTPADSDATTGSYGPGAVNGVVQGSDTSSRFRFTVPTPPGVSSGTRLTATARVAGNTSEFSAFLAVLGSPAFTITKLSTAVSDPVNCTVPGSSASCTPAASQKRIPGAIVEYQVIASNAGGAADSDSFFVVSPVPSEGELVVADIAGAGTGPVALAQGATPSGLTYTFTSFASALDDVDFSTDGTTFGYQPTVGPNGCDPNVTHVRINPKGVFVADTSTPDPSVQLRFRICVK